MSFNGDVERHIINSFFIGPKAANLPDFRANINTILDELLETRLDYMPEDNKFISKDDRRSDKFRHIRDMVGNVVRKTAQVLGEHSVPFWSPRYEGHMSTDMTMASLLGYFMTMLFNPNNVAFEASPLTTVAEFEVGQQLCKLFGYTENKTEKENITPWGHITCDGTIANLESIWVARNLKFYPLALQWAMTTPESKLFFIPDFEVETCARGPDGKAVSKNFRTMGVWDLLNLRPETVLDLPDTLRDLFGITSDFLAEALKKFNIQTTGRQPLEEKFGIKEPIQYLIGKTRHYSWPKGTAIAGIGDGNITEIDVDIYARVNTDLLRQTLIDYAKKGQAVYAVVAVMGSTEEGAVERLSKILEIRKEMQDKHGMSFLVHADAAWGGYFATMLNPKNETPGESAGERLPRSEGHLVPSLCLKKDTDEDLRALKDADSITVDPHKAGYVPYPAGSLVYRDERMRYLVSWSSPYLSQGSTENMGIYGVEGSKPGAAALSTWLSNEIIGLNPTGYGMLLGEAAFTSAILSAHYATMGHTPREESKTKKYFVCVPFNILKEENPAEKQSFFADNVLRKREQIRDIIRQDTSDIQGNKDTIEKLRELGSDLNINAFALNWYDEKGNLNTSLEEANYLMKQVVDELSITSTDTDPTKIPLYLTSTTFEPQLYGECAQKFMDRLGVNPCKQDLFVLRNVVMSPFPTRKNFVGQLMQTFEGVINKKVEDCRERNKKGPRKDVEFLLQGNDKVFLVLQTSFYWATLRQQVIVEAELDDDLRARYRYLKSNNSGDTLILISTEEIDLEAMIKSVPNNNTSTFKAQIYRKEDLNEIKDMKKDGTDWNRTENAGSVKLTHVVKSRPLNSNNRDLEYPPEFMPFYLYGTKKEKHIAHMLLKAPNVALSASNVTFTPELPENVHAQLPSGLIVTLSDIPEAPMQPFPNYIELPKSFPFKNKGKFNVKLWKDPKGFDAEGPGLLDDLENSDFFGTFKMTLGDDVDVDEEGPNKDPIHSREVDRELVKKELGKIENMIRPIKKERGEE